MKLINASVGKVGFCVIGPKHYLNESINLGEVAICIAREDGGIKPCIWLVGGVEQLIDYVSLAREKGEIEENVIEMLLAKLDEADKVITDITKSAMSRLASAVCMEVDELKEIIKLAQVCISAPIEGVQDYSGVKPKWLSKTNNYASIH